MGLFTRLFNKSQEPVEKVNDNNFENNLNSFQAEWEPIPAFIPADKSDYQLVSVIATAIAAGDYPDSQFVVKKILQRNPEALKVSVIAASIAAGESSDSQLAVKNIYQKK
ncbi:hypothetical protein ACVR0O_03060 [Streptococcus caviae]|uniref:hypothetical protein n=1 Tax=Streptococcus sp. 'caviae' TaxID=1915004 RepID=UPI00094BAEF6|nr:hypothetical protein [Streptococcus sp. 'caviae']OLN83965.1 hypothetical protein BMI76_04605 [Streptococcus sp. 'caviae']